MAADPVVGSQDPDEVPSDVLCRSGVRLTGDGIVGDHVHKHQVPARLQEPPEGVSALLTVVHSGQEAVLDEHSLLPSSPRDGRGRPAVVVDLSHEPVQRRSPRGGHDLLPQLLGRRVQGHGQAHGGGESGLDKARDTPRDSADRRYGHGSRTEAEEFPLSGQEPGRGHHAVVVFQRLAHAHEDDLVDVPSDSAGEPDLLQDLPGLQAADEAQCARGAELATHAATSLGRQAERGPGAHPHPGTAAELVLAPVVDDDGLDLHAVLQRHKQLHGAVR
mmetsp:Transcript_988/g.3317  ORF Transcript_988/g.3317 Transcript_988/m.3317 type:complete len:275 (+) Transcript_988:377-1201(+)